RGRTGTGSAKPRSSRACPASRRSPARQLPCTQSRTRAPRSRNRCRRGSALPRRERLSVVAAEAYGPYTLLRVERGGIKPGVPGQFFMLEAPGRVLPRPMSLCLAPAGELAFLIDPIGPGACGLCARRPGDALTVFGPLGNGFRLDV